MIRFNQAFLIGVFTLLYFTIKGKVLLYYFIFLKTPGNKFKYFKAQKSFFRKIKVIKTKKIKLATLSK